MFLHINIPTNSYEHCTMLWCRKSGPDLSHDWSLDLFSNFQFPVETKIKSKELDFQYPCIWNDWHLNHFNNTNLCTNKYLSVPNKVTNWQPQYFNKKCLASLHIIDFILTLTGQTQWNRWFILWISFKRMILSQTLIALSQSLCTFIIFFQN